MSEYLDILRPMDYIDNQELTHEYEGRILQTHPSYPSRGLSRTVAWDKPLPGYKPVEYESLTLGEPRPAWAEAKDKLFGRTEKSLIVDEILFDDKNRPLNPVGRTGISGRGKLGKWGPNIAVDSVVTRKIETGKTEVLLIERDTGQLAFPGGFYDGGEFVDEAIREVGEETALSLPRSEAQLVSSGLYVFASRMTDHAWIESVVYGWQLNGDSAKQTPTAGDDARSAGWYEVEEKIVDRLVPTHGLVLRKLYKL